MTWEEREVGDGWVALPVSNSVGGVGAVYALRYADVSRVMLGVIAVYGFGVTLANVWNILVSTPVNPSYVVAFGIMFLVSATLLIAERQNTVQRSGTT
jgi:hypothetical protein